MLFLMMKEGEYLTIGEDIVIQTFPDSSTRVRVGVQAPRDMLVLRGNLRERSGEKRPKGLVGPMAEEFSEQQQKQSHRFHPADEPVEI